MHQMEYIKHEMAIRHANSSNCIAYEYPMQNSEINIGVVEITHRYPDQGYAINHKCSEIGYILKGSGKLVTEISEVSLSCGDVVYIPHGERYYWEGNMTVVVSSTPAWHPEQHQVNLCADEVISSS